MTQDFTKNLQDMMSAFPVDNSAMQDAFRSQAQLAERLSRVALDAAEQSTEISSTWTRDTLAKLRDVSTVKDEPADYSSALTELASAQAETTSETMARFAEVAKRVQMETVELMMTAGRQMAEETTEHARTAAARGQDMAGKTQEAVTRLADQGRAAADRTAASGAKATEKEATEKAATGAKRTRSAANAKK